MSAGLRSVIFVVIVFGCIFIAAVAVALVIEGQTASKDRLERFDASFSVVSAVCSSLAFAGVLVTLWLQRQELAMQREELRLTREEHSKSVAAQDAAQRRLFLTAYLTSLSTMNDVAGPIGGIKHGAGIEEVSSAVTRRHLASLLGPLLPSLQNEIDSLYRDKECAETSKWPMLKIVDTAAKELDAFRCLHAPVGDNMLYENEVDQAYADLMKMHDTLCGVVARWPEDLETKLHRAAGYVCEAASELEKSGTVTVGPIARAIQALEEFLIDEIMA